MQKIKYPKDWKVKPLLRICEDGISNGVFNDPNKVGNGYRLINVIDLYTEPQIQTNKLSMLSISKEEFLRNKVNYGDLFFTRSSLKLEGIAHCNIYLGNDNDITYDGHIMKISPNKTIVNPLFLRLFCLSVIARKYFMQRAKQTTMTTIGQEDISELPVPIPPIKEQKKIADIFFTIDISIEKLSALVSQKLLLKKALMQQLLTGKKRFKEFRKSKWITVHLGDIFTERLERVENSNHLELLSITNDRGIIKRGEVDKIDTSSEDKSNYKIIRRGDIGYNTMRMWQGVSAVSEIDGIISPAYTVVKPKDNIAAQFMGYLFKYQPMIYTFKRYSQGMVDDTLNCKFDSFSKIKITVPPLKEEQEKIASLFNLIDVEIQIVQKKLELLKLQKKGLMQKLLTGKIRVKF